MKVYKRNETNFAFPEDMKLILDYLNAHGKIVVKDTTIEHLYRSFSDEKYCAGWMCVQIVQDKFHILGKCEISFVSFVDFHCGSPNHFVVC